ncbi:MAG TPA: hypothetical protein VFJ96_05670 [Gemmatimonadaceae bacterium]|nr:hypothetical protein [Gemmatimonadaceae bacterium]
MRVRAPRPSICIALTLVALPCVATHASAQRGREATPEFTRQGLLIVNFAPRDGARMSLGRDAADEVRSRVGKLLDKREVDVIDGRDIEDQLVRGGFDADTTFSLPLIRMLGRYLRADEFVLGSVSNTPRGLRLSGEIVLIRDERLRQPLPDAVAPKLDSAAKLFAASIAAARTQMIPERRCENAMNAMSTDRAIAEARAAVARYPRSTIARTCLARSLLQAGAPATEVLSVARAVLAIDSMSWHATEVAAIALDSLKRGAEAATLWIRLAATDTADVDLALRVSEALFTDGNARRAEPFIVRVAAAHPDDIRLTRQTWRIAFANESWTRAIAAGETLLARDTVAQRDSAFVLRLATAYHSAGNPYRAIETLAHGVVTFPGDPRMYALYAQYIQAEADTVIPRGVARFPQSAELLALRSQRLRAKDDIAQSLDALKQAVALDSTLGHGQLTVAQLEMQLGRADSALVALHRAIATGEDSALVAQFALAKGNTLYGTASGTKTTQDFTLALQFLTFADSIRASAESRFLVGAAALGAAQSALVEATKASDKAEQCRLARVGADMVPLARAGLQAGQDAFSDEAKRSLGYLDQLDPYVGREIGAYCQ